MRIALVGLGGAGQRGHLPAVQDLTAAGEAQLVGLADANMQRIPVLTRRSYGVPTYDAVSAMLEETLPDLLVVATPPTTHLPLIEAAVEQGVDVLCEKPVVPNHTHLDRLCKLGERYSHKVIATVGQYKHSRGWAKFRGAIEVAEAAGAGYDLHVRVERPGTDLHAASTWRDNAVEGGAVGDHASHYIGLVHEVSPKLRLLDSYRSLDPYGRESASVLLTAGTGVMRVDVDYGAEKRETSMHFSCKATATTVGWIGGVLTIRSPEGTTDEPAEALHYRSTVDELYKPFYREFVTRLRQPLWRAHMTATTLAVGRLVTEATNDADQQAIGGTRSGGNRG